MPKILFLLCHVIIIIFYSISAEIKCGLGLGCFGVSILYWVKFGWQLLCWWGLGGRWGAGEGRESREVLTFFIKIFRMTKTKIIYNYRN